MSGIGSLTENISSYVDFYIKSFVPMLSSYVRDSMDFIESLYGVDFAVDDVLLAINKFNWSSFFQCADFTPPFSFTW